MHMILVEPISIRPKRRAETTTRRGIHTTQRRPVFARPPIFQHRNPFPVVQRKSGNIDGVTLGVFRNFCAALAVTCPARVMRNHPQAGDPCLQRPHRWLRPTIHPFAQSPRRIAVQNWFFVQRHTGNEMHFNWSADTARTARNLDRRQDNTGQTRVTTKLHKMGGDRWGRLASPARYRCCQNQQNQKYAPKRQVSPPRPKLASSVSCPASIILRRTARVRVK